MQPERYYHLDKTYLPNPLQMGNVRLFQIGRAYCREETVIAPHVHREWIELTIVTDGEGIVFTNDVELPVKSGDIHISFPADKHMIISSKDKPLRYDYISFYPNDEQKLRKIEELMTTFRSPHDRLFADEKIKMLVSNAIAEFCGEQDGYSQEILVDILNQTIIYLIRDFQNKKGSYVYSSVNAAEILCYQVMHYIDTHIFALKNLTELSRFTNYNYSYLSTLFKKTTGRTMLEYYQESKLKTARCMIHEKKLKIGEISELLNYSSVYAFSKAYKKKYGISPATDRKNATD